MAVSTDHLELIRFHGFVDRPGPDGDVESAMRAFGIDVMNVTPRAPSSTVGTRQVAGLGTRPSVHAVACSARSAYRLSEPCR